MPKGLFPMDPLEIALDGTPFSQGGSAVVSLTDPAVRSLIESATAGTVKVGSDGLLEIRRMTIADVSVFPTLKIVGKDLFMNDQNPSSAAATVVMPELVEVKENGFNNVPCISSFSAPKLVKIEKRGFYRCRYVTSFSANSLENAGEQCFAACERLASLSFPSLSAIGEYAFSGCKALANVSIPSYDDPDVEDDDWEAWLGEDYLGIGEECSSPVTVVTARGTTVVQPWS